MKEVANASIPSPPNAATSIEMFKDEVDQEIDAISKFTSEVVNRAVEEVSPLTLACHKLSGGCPADSTSWKDELDVSATYADVSKAMMEKCLATRGIVTKMQNARDTMKTSMDQWLTTLSKFKCEETAFHTSCKDTFDTLWPLIETTLIEAQFVQRMTKDSSS